MQEKELIEKSKTESRAYGELYKKYANRVFNFFMRRVGGNKDVAQDLTQETFTRAFMHRRRFVEKGYPYGAYLFTIARRLLINQYKKKSPVFVDDTSQFASTGQSPEDLYFRREIWQAIRNMREIDRQVLMYKYQQGYSVREISERIGRSENAVKLILSRARKKLKMLSGLSD